MIGLALLGLAGGLAPVADAQLNRTAVSVLGNDANTCAVATLCRSFARAVGQTNPGGEVVALDSACYGAFTADRTITVQAAPGVYAGITASSGTSRATTARARATTAARWSPGRTTRCAETRSTTRPPAC